MIYLYHQKKEVKPMNFNNYYYYNNGNQTVSTNYDRQTAELMAIQVVRFNKNVTKVLIVNNTTMEIVKTYLQSEG